MNLFRQAMEKCWKCVALKQEILFGERKAVMNGLKEIPTCQLVEELKSREGVEQIVVEPYEDFKMNVNGAAVVLIVMD